jgi:enamine deaminase RidA (YjgF/YER057c/UK114 family)
MSEAEDKLSEMGLALSSPPPPLANYVPAVRTGNLVFLAGVGPRTPDGHNITGKVGRDLNVDQAKEAARQCGLNLLANLKGAIGDLDNVTRVVKVLGMVNAVPEFGDHPQVINGCSDLLVAVFGDKGRHARAAVGMGSLPNGIAVEIEMVVEVQS